MKKVTVEASIKAPYTEDFGTYPEELNPDSYIFSFLPDGLIMTAFFGYEKIKTIRIGAEK